MRRLNIISVFLCLTSALEWQYIVAEVFSSMADVETLVTTEKLALEILRNLLRQERQRVTEIKRFTARMKNIAGNMEDESNLSPVKMFQRLKYHWTDLNYVVDLASVDNFREQNRSINRLRLTRAFPDSSDIEGNADAFARLQVTYKIHPQDIARGQIPGTRRTVPFSSQEAFLIGHNQAVNKFFNSAAAWLETALQIYNEETEKTADPVEIYDWLHHSIYSDSGNAIQALEFVRKIREIDPAYPTLDVKTKIYEEAIRNMTAEETEKFRNDPNATITFDTNSVDYVNVSDVAYEALCRGESIMDPNPAPNLKCYYQTYSNPFLLIQPVKVEKLYEDPEILLFHNVIFDSQADRLRRIGYDHLNRGRVMDIGADGTGIVSKYRTAKIAFLPEKTDPVIGEINRYIGHATNLDMNIAEELQINNYGIGGHYYPHFDFLTDVYDNPNLERNSPNLVGVIPNLVGPMNNHSQWGDRLATFLAYMTDVEAGGATVFPHLNLTLFPKKGSAAFWYNKFRDGSPDIRMLHAGCPVLSGIKWVSNKWIRENGQDQYRPCGLVQDGFANLTQVLEEYYDAF